LRVLYRLQSEADVADELAGLSATRDADPLDHPL
jgi:hypothetical protein